MYVYSRLLCRSSVVRCDLSCAHVLVSSPPFGVTLQMCAVLFPLWVAWMLLGYAQLRPILPISVIIQVINLAIYIALPLWLFSTDRKDMTGIEWPGVFLYALQTFVVAAYIFFRGKGWKYAVGYILLVAMAAVVRMLHSSYIFDEYVRSESDKILVVLVYQPLTSMGLLSRLPDCLS